MATALQLNAVTINLSQELYEKLMLLSERMDRSPEEIALVALEDYLDLESAINPNRDEIKHRLKQAWREVLSQTPTRPIWDILNEMDDEPAND